MAAARKVKFQDQKINSEPDVEQKALPTPLTGRPQNSSKTSEDDKKKK